MQKKKPGLSLILSACLVVGLGVLAFGIYQQHVAQPKTLVVVPPSPSPTPVPMSQVSPDGTHTVSLNVQADVVQILVNDKVVATRRVVPDEQILLPFTAWSPNNAYFFLEDKAPSGIEYLVFTATGAPIAKDTQYFAVANLFAAAYPLNTLVAATGWASPTLLVVNATSAKESTMSFWFDVQTHKFIRLATYFN